MENERIKKQWEQMTKLRLTPKAISRGTGLGYNTVWRYFHGEIHKPVNLDYYGRQIDIFLSAEFDKIVRVNPELHGGGE